MYIVDHSFLASQCRIARIRLKSAVHLVSQELQGKLRMNEHKRIDYRSLLIVARSFSTKSSVYAHTFWRCANSTCQVQLAGYTSSRLCIDDQCQS